VAAVVMMPLLGVYAAIIAIIGGATISAHHAAHPLLQLPFA
jgi:ABC-type transporter Mla maintaining outer membrane lipid asymmetry permease subunit MlaE